MKRVEMNRKTGTKVCLIVFGAVVVLMGISGCKVDKSGQPGIIDHLTGAQQVKNYDKAKTQIQDINKTLEERYKQI